MNHIRKFSIDPSWKIMLTDIGADIDTVLKYAGLPGDLFSRKTVKISAQDYFRLWGGITKFFRNNTFPLKLAQSITTEAFHPVFFAALCSANMKVSLKRLNMFKNLAGPVKLHVENRPEFTSIRIRSTENDLPLPEHLVAAELVFFVHFFRLATRKRIVPLSITSTTKIVLDKEYSEFFGITPTYGEADIVKFSCEDAEYKFVTEKMVMWEFFEPMLEKQLKEVMRQESFAHTVHCKLMELLPAGESSIEVVADHLSMSKRTLQRNLNSEDTTFQKVLNSTRETLAIHYLSRSELTVENIAILLGFNDPGSFIRAFRSWTGNTPGKVRETGTFH